MPSFSRTLDRRDDPPDPDRAPLRRSVALVTGAGRGIGRLLAEALAGAGAAVALIARSADDLAGTVALVEAGGGDAAAVTADVTDAPALAAAVATLGERLGPIDVLVNNAGVLGPIGPLWEVDESDWWRAMDVNVRGLLNATRLVLPGMISRGRGRVINITSQAGAYRWPLVSAYSVSKSAVVKLTENLAHETSRHGIRAFSVHPGLLPIGMSQTVADHTPASVHEARIQEWALTQLAEGRGARPDQAVELILRVARGDADALSGRHLSVHDDLDTLLERASEVRQRDLYVLRPERLD